MNQLTQYTGDVERDIATETRKFKAELPDHVDVARFQRVAANAVLHSKGLEEVYRLNPESVITACLAAAKDGLLPDGREAAIVPMRDNGSKRAVYVPMITGILKLARQSGEITAISAAVIHENDFIDYELGSNEFVKHRPALRNRGKMDGAWAIFHTKDGGQYIDVMGADEILAIKKFSKSAKGPWHGEFEGEMWKKTVLRRLAKRAPLSTDLFDVIARNDNLIDLEAANNAQTEKKPQSLADLSEQNRKSQSNGPQYAPNQSPTPRSRPRIQSPEQARTSERSASPHETTPSDKAPRHTRNESRAAKDSMDAKPETVRPSSVEDDPEEVVDVVEEQAPALPPVDLETASEVDRKKWAAAFILLMHSASPEDLPQIWGDHARNLDWLRENDSTSYDTADAIYEEKVDQ